nr:hypothetical protein [Tanacetum cinerariifolium]
VDDAHVADAAGTKNVLLLAFVQQQGVGLRGDLHVASQAQKFLLGGRQGLDFLQQGCFLGFHLADLGHQAAIGRVLWGVQTLDVDAFHLQ